jgi:virulence-associated protein VagC
MPLTRVFKPGNSQAVRIPAELAYAEPTSILKSHDWVTSSQLSPLASV